MYYKRITTQTNSNLRRWLQIRDWLYVEDHCTAIRKILDKGISGETYNIGGNNEKTNIQIVNKICEILDELKPSYKKILIKN